MGVIIFFEQKNCQGRSYECSADCSDVHMHLNRCFSCKVDSGCFVVYDRPNFMGNQVFLRRGETSNHQSMGGTMGPALMDSIRSCRMIQTHRGPFRLRMYESENFGGQMHELMEDCESVQDRYSMSNCHSCNVMEGHWLMFEQQNYKGRMVYVRPGEYRNLRDMGVNNMMTISSIKRITDVC
uniref:Gamma-crystallin M3-like n=1 Tax=Gouania willdenowi TaxID=441366 RepID=A0A8C5E8S1_GOUWI